MIPHFRGEQIKILPKRLRVSDRSITCTNQVHWTNHLLDLTVGSPVVNEDVESSGERNGNIVSVNQ